MLAAAAFGEKGGTTTNIEGRVTTVGQKVTPRGTSRPDWMIAAELAELLGADLGRVARSTTSPTPSPPTSPATTRPRVAALRGRARRRASCNGSLPLPPLTGRPIDDRNSYDYRLVVSRKLYDRAVGTGEVAVAGHARPRAAAAPPPARPRARRRRPTAPTSRSPATGIDRVPGRRRRHRAARHRPGCRSTSPAPSIGELIDATDAGHRRADREPF